MAPQAQLVILVQPIVENSVIRSIATYSKLKIHNFQFNMAASKTKGSGGIIPKKKNNKSSKHEPPSPSLKEGGTKTDSSDNTSMKMNRASRRRKMKEDGALVDRGGNKDSSQQKSSTSTATCTYTAVQDQQSQGEKIFACLNSNCTKTFEVWRTARNHMNNCKIGDKPEGKPRIKDSRKKGNELLEQGKAKLTEFPPLPTATELAKFLRDFHSKNQNLKMNDVSFIMRLAIRPHWGFALGDFSTLGCGTWEDFRAANDIFHVEDAEQDVEQDAE